jgi:hypothetical protein
MCDARAGVEEVALGARGRKKSLGSVYQSRAADDKCREQGHRPCHCHNSIDRRNSDRVQSNIMSRGRLSRERRQERQK